MALRRRHSMQSKRRCELVLDYSQLSTASLLSVHLHGDDSAKATVPSPRNALFLAAMRADAAVQCTTCAWPQPQKVPGIETSNGDRGTKVPSIGARNGDETWNAL